MFFKSTAQPRPATATAAAQAQPAACALAASLALALACAATPAARAQTAPTAGKGNAETAAATTTATTTATAASPAAATRTDLPPAVWQALARAQVPADAVAMAVVALPDAAAPSAATATAGERNPTPATAAPALPAPRLWWRADAAMNPASVMKLVTTYAGLDLLGPSHFWRTRIYTQGSIGGGVLRGNLLVQGGGDPKLVHERLAALLADIQAKGVRHITGDIVLDNSVFATQGHDPAAFDGDALRPYNAGPDGLLVNFKTVALHFTPDGAGRVHVRTEPPLAAQAVPAHIRAVRGACGNWQQRLAADFSQPGRIAFAGGYPAACGAQSWTVAWPDAAAFAPLVFEGMWRASGAGLDGRVRWIDKPATARLLLTGFSLPLQHIVADINKHSNNVMAQQLFLSLSAQNGRGGFAQSREVLARWWRSRFGAATPPVVDNGAGLSRQARVSAASLIALLNHAAASTVAAPFAQSLPIAGVDGTARGMNTRSPGSEAIGNAIVKTGTLRDVVAIAGYGWGRSGRQYAVVGIVNHPNAAAARPALDRLLEWTVAEAP